MKRSLSLLALLPLALCACTPSESATPTTTPPTTPSTTPIPSATPSPTPTVETNSACNEITFFLDPALATGFTCETIAADPGPIAPHPEMTRITLVGYPPSAHVVSPQIFVMSIADYTSLEPTWIPGLVTDLQALAGGGTPPVFDPSVAVPFPILPEQSAISVFFAQYGVVPFVDGSGIRFITELSFDVVPISNDRTLYVYQGLTADGQYWVSAILPIRNTILVADDSVLPMGMTWSDFYAQYETYIADIVNQLNTQPSGTFEPLITALDALVSSITFVP